MTATDDPINVNHVYEMEYNPDNPELCLKSYKNYINKYVEDSPLSAIPATSDKLVWIFYTGISNFALKL